MKKDLVVCLPVWGEDNNPSSVVEHPVAVLKEREWLHEMLNE